MKLNLRSLEAFRETMISGSVTAAAGRMGMTQPAVSRLIAQLETDAGFGLFYRDKGRLAPTPEALMLYEEVDLAFGGLERVDDLVRVDDGCQAACASGDVEAAERRIRRLEGEESVLEALPQRASARGAQSHNR
jgi:hypothetical protein